MVTTITMKNVVNEVQPTTSGWSFPAIAKKLGSPLMENMVFRTENSHGRSD